jgi:hypothetical protein
LGAKDTQAQQKTSFQLLNAAREAKSSRAFLFMGGNSGKGRKKKS